MVTGRVKVKLTAVAAAPGMNHGKTVTIVMTSNATVKAETIRIVSVVIGPGVEVGAGAEIGAEVGAGAGAETGVGVGAGAGGAEIATAAVEAEIATAAETGTGATDGAGAGAEIGTAVGDRWVENVTEKREGKVEGSEEF